MKAKKEIIMALDATKKEILDAIQQKKGRTKRKLLQKEVSPLKEQFEALSEMLNSQEQPNRFKIMSVAGSLVDVLEKEGEVADGLLDILSPRERHSMLMLFLFHMLKAADEPEKVPLEEEDALNRNPYNKRSVGKLDKGF